VNQGGLTMANILQAREKEINEGKAKFTDFNRAKERIKKETKRKLISLILPRKI
jgi:hypothetical protein